MLWHPPNIEGSHQILRPSESFHPHSVVLSCKNMYNSMLLNGKPGNLIFLRLLAENLLQKWDYLESPQPKASYYHYRGGVELFSDV
jgi:hypothetical protein